jgi:sugar phosphate isomerase/epimerase
MFKTGVVSVSFRQLSVDEVIRCTKEAGLSHIEWGSDVHAPYDDPEKLAYIAKAQEEAGIVCPSYGTYFKLGVDDVELLHGYSRAARTLGTDVLRLWCGNKNYTDLTPEEREFMLSECKKAAKIAEEEGVVLCMECHQKSFTNVLEGALDLMRSVNSPAFRMYWQPSTKDSVEYNLEYARGIKDYVDTIHVFYYKDGKKAYLAEGAEDWRKYLAVFSGNEKLLLEFMPDGTPATLPGEAAALNSLAAEFN